MAHPAIVRSCFHLGLCGPCILSELAQHSTPERSRGACTVAGLSEWAQTLKRRLTVSEKNSWEKLLLSISSHLSDFFSSPAASQLQLFFFLTTSFPWAFISKITVLDLCKQSPLFLNISYLMFSLSLPSYCIPEDFNLLFPRSSRVWLCSLPCGVRSESSSCPHYKCTEAQLLHSFLKAKVSHSRPQD